MVSSLATTKTKWSIDQSHSRMDFKVRHLMISNIKGSFKSFNANIYTTMKEFSTAEVDLWIDAASICTDDVTRDEHLRSAEFFDVQNHKQIRFNSISIGLPDAENNCDLLGKLMIKGITKRVKLKVLFGGMISDPSNIDRLGITVEGKIKRSDWGLLWNTTLEKGGVMVSDEVTISCEFELINSYQVELKLKNELAHKQETNV
jgi:polyisoprenoid-binding protein YceI